MRKMVTMGTNIQIKKIKLSFVSPNFPVIPNSCNYKTAQGHTHGAIFKHTIYNNMGKNQYIHIECKYGIL